MYTQGEIIEKAKKVHGDRYDYSLVKYKKLIDNVEIICNEHGIFKQSMHAHLRGQGCPLCGIKKRSLSKKYNTEEFIKKARKVHGEKYDYSNVDYLSSYDKVIITCPIHGNFEQRPSEHLLGKGCWLCAQNYNKNVKRSNSKEFIERANIIHSNKYDYKKVLYYNSATKVIITCPIHGDFEQTPSSHISGNGCPHCAQQLSIAENEIYELCCKYIGKENVEQRNRTMIKPKELDIYIPSLKTGIEYNGLRWHSEKFNRDRLYHINKLNSCKNNGISLLQIFEDEYINHKEIVINKIKHILKIQEKLPKIAGRKCTIKVIDSKESNKFLEKYHIQGYVASTIHLGAFYEGNLIGVMSFKQMLSNSGEWELTRFASDYNYICQGVGGKLFKFFIKNYNPIFIKSFADRRWTIDEYNNIYIQLGFKFDSYTNPEYRYYKESDGCVRQHKFKFRKQKLNKKYNLPLTMTEVEMTSYLGYTRIYDCGLIKYIWEKNKKED